MQPDPEAVRAALERARRYRTANTAGSMPRDHRQAFDDRATLAGEIERLRRIEQAVIAYREAAERDDTDGLLSWLNVVEALDDATGGPRR